MMDDFYCVIPVYNNASTIHDVVERCRKQTPHILIVDDGSTDTNLAEHYCGTDIEVLRHEQNRGKGAALKTALEYLAEKDIAYMIAIDGDGQHYPEDIPRFLPFMEKNDGALLIGCRDFNTENVPRSSRFGRAFANFWMRLETGLQLDDCQSGFRAYPIRYITQLPCLANHYNFETEILVRAAWANLELRDIPIRTYYPEPEKRISHFRPGLDNFRISCIHVHLIGIRLLPYPKKKLRPGKKFDLSLLHPKAFFLRLLKENATPAGLAAAAATGTFLAVIPIPGFHSIAILYAAERLHLNKLMALNIQHFFMPPLSPFLCIETGYFMMHGHFWTEFTFDTVVREMPSRLLEWFLGSLLLAPFFAGITTGIVFLIASCFHKKGKGNVTTK